jgi:hypothetical protein
VELAEMAEELAVGDVVEPALADESGADEGAGEGDAEEDLDEEVVVVQHLRDGCGHTLHFEQTSAGLGDSVENGISVVD